MNPSEPILWGRRSSIELELNRTVSDPSGANVLFTESLILAQDERWRRA